MYQATPNPPPALVLGEDATPFERPPTRDSEARLVGVKAFSIRTIPAYLFLAIITIYCLTPLLWLFIATTKDNTDLFATFGLWFAPNNNLWSNFTQILTFQNSAFPHWLWNSIIYAVVGGLGAALISTMAGYAMAKYRFVGRNLIFSMVIGAALVPVTTLALPIYLEESKLQITNTYWGFLLPALLSPIGVFLARVYAQASVQDDLIAAARVDGASEWRIFFTIAMPILRPGFITIFLVSFVGIWNTFFLPLIVLSDPGLFPVNLGLATWNFDPAAHQVIYDLIVTGAALSVLPLIAMFLFLQRYWRSGLAFGSLTG